MSEVSKLTRAAQRAHVNVLKGFDRAKREMADIPLGHERVDPRTHKKRVEEGRVSGLDPTLARILYQIRAEQAGNQLSGDTEQ